VRGLLGADADDEESPEAAARSPFRATPSLWDRVVSRVPLRLDPGHRGALAVGLAVLLAAVITGVWLMSSRPQAVPVSAAVPSVPGSQPLVGTGGPTVPASGGLVSLTVTDPASVPASSALPAEASTSAGVVVVDVAGKVRHPGVYRLASGSRVDDAVTAAGGPVGRVDLSSLNLAAVVADGEQILVGAPGTSMVSGGGATAAVGGGPDASTAAAIVDLNSATLEQLETLPGVGPVLGQNVLDWRSAHGSFTSIDQLQDVTGIGDVKFAALQPLVSL
jgi:competence protein ComEA